ncbi:glycosyltransferase family 39 protein [Amycolatopsis sp. 195334CR]|uniref:glycosyltransferase family 39 protein n=1 Tax=Amycolatopsis sp. 195334CR TaxID=2814588 RepID=UPI001A8DBF91|nr:glycosyltransferase family 39 protein [Amycolatopsis sp. 195334CR]MBN6034385.1 glycosyltransferase family 39 protein [Amycolatopsis sp. 195334CR]
MVALICGWLLLAALVLGGWTRISTSRAWRVAALTLAVAYSLAHQALFSTVAEDAFITFRYSENLADGNGPVFNAGERVEGYSNFLWMVLIAIPKALFGKGIVVGAAVLGVVCTVACVVLSYFLVNRMVGKDTDRALGVLAAVLTAGASGLAAYGPSGLETPLFLLLVLGVLYALAAKRPLIAGLLVALSGMTRPDGLLIAVLVGLYLLVRAIRKRTGWRPVLEYAAGLLVLALPWTIWRVVYYGHLLPNAVAAKSGGSFGWQLAQGGEYLGGFALASLGFLVLAALAMIGLVRFGGESEHRSLVWLTFGLAFAYLAFITYAGGDWMPAYRLLAPVPPLLGVASVAAYGMLDTERLRARVAGLRLMPLAAAAICGLSLLVSITDPKMLDLMHQWRAKIAEMEEFGSLLGQNLPPGTLISTYANGALSYRAGPGVPVVDVLGLTDEHIARNGLRTEESGPIGHIAHDYDYVVNVRKPALGIVTGNGFAVRPQCTDDAIYRDSYQVANFRREGTQLYAVVFPRKDQAGRLIAALDADPRFVYEPCPATAPTP